MKKIIFIIIFSFLLKNNIVLANETLAISSIEATSTKETLIKTYELEGSIANYEQLIPNEVEHNGDTYIKKDIKVEEKTKTENVDIVEPVEKVISAKEKSKAISLFEKELNYNKNDYKGTLILDESTLNISKNEIETVTKYETKKYTIYEDKTYYGLESNDYSLLPQTITKDGVVLKLITADFIKTNSKDTYNCNTKYGGTFQKKIPKTKQLVKNYKATVSYKGSVTKEFIEKRIITVFYEKEKDNKDSVIEVTQNENIISDNLINMNATNENIVSDETIINTDFESIVKSDNQMFTLFIIVILMLFLLVLIMVIALCKNERRKRFEEK